MIEKSVHLLVEGDLDEHVLRRLVAFASNINVGQCYGKNGKEQVKKKVLKYNAAANPHLRFICLVDLDTDTGCPSELRAAWFPKGVNPHLLFRIAVREVEAWLLADQVNFASFLGVSENKITLPTDNIHDPKQFIVNLARTSNHREIQKNIVPPSESRGIVGKAYSSTLNGFVLHHWDIAKAMDNSRSLSRALTALDKFTADVPE
jgi:hypothetical protein